LTIKVCKEFNQDLRKFCKNLIWSSNAGTRMWLQCMVHTGPKLKVLIS